MTDAPAQEWTDEQTLLESLKSKAKAGNLSIFRKHDGTYHLVLCLAKPTWQVRSTPNIVVHQQIYPAPADGKVAQYEVTELIKWNKPLQDKRLRYTPIESVVLPKGSVQ